MSSPEQQNVIAERFCLRQQVGREQDGGAPIRSLPNQILKDLNCNGVETTEWFIQDEQIWFMLQCRRKLDRAELLDLLGELARRAARLAKSRSCWLSLVLVLCICVSTIRSRSMNA